MAKTCSKCILTDSIPGITFDENGLCNICRDYFKNPVSQKKNTENFRSILKTNPKKHKYDCLCLYSGGKDSTYMLYNLVTKYNLRVLAFTLDNWFMSEDTFSNIDKVISKLKIDNIVCKPEWELVSSLFKTGIQRYHLTDDSKKMAFLIGHACWPCFTMISVYSIKTAIKHNIPNIVVGTTPGQLRQKDKNLLAKYKGVTDVYKNMVQPLLNIVDKKVKDNLDLSFIEKIKALSLKLVPFYEYFPYNEKRAFDTAKEVFDWKRPVDTDSCSTNCLINSLGVAIHRKMYNLNPYVIPLAHDVRIGVADRDEALRAVNATLDFQTVLKIAEKLELEAKEFILHDLSKAVVKEKEDKLADAEIT